MMVAENCGEGEHAEVPAELERRFDRICEQGYESMPSAQTAGVFNLSAPVLDTDGIAVAALTIPYIGLVNRESAPDMSDATHMLLEAARALSLETGIRAAD